MEGLDDGITNVASGMGSVLVEEKEEPSVHGHQNQCESEGSPERMVFSIPGLIDQIIAECALLQLTQEVLTLRLVCTDFNESVLNIQAFPINLEKPWMKQPNLTMLEIANRDNGSDEPLRLRRLSSSELAAIAPRICRHITAEFGFSFDGHHRGDYGGEDAVAFHNLIGICDIHGQCIRSMVVREFHVAEHHLVTLMKRIEDHCPNLQHLEVYISGSCSDPGLHEGEDEALTFGPHLGLTKIIFRIFPREERAAALKDSRPCGYTLPVMSALVKGSPNLVCLKVEKRVGPLRLDLSRHRKLRRLEYFAFAKDGQQSLKDLWKGMYDIRETLEKLSIVLQREKPLSVDNETLEQIAPPGLMLPKLKRLKLLVIAACHSDSTSRTLLRLILNGVAPQLEYLEFNAGLDCWHTVLSSRGLHHGPRSWNVTILNDVSLEWNSAVHHLHLLVKSFPKLVQMQMRVAIVAGPPPSEEDMRDELRRLVLAFQSWEQLSTVRFNVEHSVFGISIQELVVQVWDGDTGEDDELVWNRASVAPAEVHPQEEDNFD